MSMAAFYSHIVEIKFN